MNYLFVFMSLCISLVSSRHWHSKPTYLRCRKAGVACLNKNLFVYCKYPYEKVILERDGLSCPEGYLCQEDSQYPCIQDPENFASTPNDCTTNKETTTKAKISEDEIITNTEPYWTTEDTRGSSTPEEVNDFTTIESLSTPEENSDESTENTNTEESRGDTNTEESRDPVRRASPLPSWFCSSYDDIYPGPTCSQYYICEWHWIWWYRPSLKNCNEGEIFSPEKLRCVPSSDSECID